MESMGGMVMERNKMNDYTELEKRLESDGLRDAMRSITLPRQVKDGMMEHILVSRTIKYGRTGNNTLHRMRRTRLAAAAACLLLVFATTGLTAHAVYLNRHLDVFFEKDITKEQMYAIEAQLRQMEGIASCRYIDADTAWKTFGEAYLTPELMEGFTENPLADSASFRVGVSMDADAERMKTLIGELDGVRLVSGLWEE